VNGAKFELSIAHILLRNLVSYILSFGIGDTQMVKVTLSFAVQVGATVTALFSGSIACADTLRIGGTGAALGSMSVLAEAFEDRNPGNTIQVLPSLGSSGGVKALVAQAIDLSVSARPLKDKETAAGASAKAYARTQLVFATTRGNDVTGVTTEQLEQVYNGTISHWADGRPIRLVMRPAAESDTRILRGLSVALDRAVGIALDLPGLVSATNDQENAALLERLEGSLGMIPMGQIATENRRLNILSLDGHDPTDTSENAPDGPLTKTFYLVSTDNISPLASDFRDFVYSDEGRALLSDYAFTPAG